MRRILFASLPAAALLLLAGCVSQPEAPAPAAPVAVPAPAPAPPPTPAAPVSADWRDWPLTQGSWVYRQDARGSIALFGQAGSDAEVTLRCDRGRQRLYLSRRGEAAPGTAARMTVRTTSTMRTLTLLPTGGVPPYLAAELPVNDALIDAIGFSRGRFVIEGGRLATLVIPAWAELLRVAEDCRG